MHDVMQPVLLGTCCIGSESLSLLRPKVCALPCHKRHWIDMQKTSTAVAYPRHQQEVMHPVSLIVRVGRSKSLKMKRRRLCQCMAFAQCVMDRAKNCRA